MRDTNEPTKSFDEPEIIDIGTGDTNIPDLDEQTANSIISNPNSEIT